MAKIKIITDSSSDLPKSYYEENNIDVFYFPINLAGEEYIDQITLTTNKLYELVDAHGVLPKTAAIGVYQFQQKFEETLKEYDQVLFIGISSGFSCQVSNAHLASQEFDGKVKVFDSKNLSSGEGLVVMKAVELVNKGLDIEEVYSELTTYAENVRSQFAIETMDYLHKGGRCSGVVYFLGKGLKIKPIIRVVDGKMVVYKKPIGKMKNALDKLMDIFLEDLPNIDPTRVMITHSLGHDSCEYLKARLAEHIDPSIIMETNAGATISTHCGKGTIGILYALK